jgi:hypothetical protein
LNRRPAVGVVRRVVARGRADDRREHRALLDGQVLRVDAEVGLRRGLDAVGAATEVDGVEVVLEDLVLVVAAGQLHRDEELLELARVGALRGEVGVLRVLLGDRRAALRGAAAQVGPERARDAGRRDAAVLVEGPVLGGEHGLLHVVGHLVERDDDPVLLAEAADLGLAVVEVDDRRLRGDERLGLRDVGGGVRHAQQRDHRQEPHCDKGQELPPRRHVAADAVVRSRG